jgi:hypothetical protein
MINPESMPQIMRSVLAQTTSFFPTFFKALRITGCCGLPDVPCHNNSVEREIKHYATGRKCWFFCYHKVGAQASANLFSLALTCRANEVDRFEYFSYLFEHLPMATTLQALEALLPWNVKPILEERRLRREAALRSAAAY